MEHIVIIGNGISGITAARHIRKRSDKRITVISGESDYFFSRTALMYVYMGHMKWEHLKPYEDWFWKENSIELKKAWVTHVDVKEKVLEIADGSAMNYDQLVLATGSVYNKFGWPGEDLDGVQGLVSKQDLELLEKNTANISKAVIVGGGLIGVELAEMLKTRKIEVTYLVRERAFWQNVLPFPEAEMISGHIQEHGVDLRHHTQLKRILPDEKGGVKAIETDSGEIIQTDLVGLCTGVKPNISFLETSGLDLDRGILVNKFLETSAPDVYAIGDCAQQRESIGKRKTVEAVWYTGRIMGETIAKTLTGEKTEYQPGNWFNSAKFFDIEYQTYGWVMPRESENEAHFHWQHANQPKAVTIAFNPGNNEFLGINTFGIRMRHEVFDQWLTEKRSVSHVLSNLRNANFDPEFYDRYEKEIFRSFKSKFQKTR